jgi:hypothetical protein
VIPEWKGTIDDDNIDKGKIDRGEIPSWVYIALASTIIIAVIVIKKPEWGTAILNGLKSLWNAMRYFGGSTRLFAKNVLKPAAEYFTYSRTRRCFGYAFCHCGWFGA